MVDGIVAAATALNFERDNVLRTNHNRYRYRYVGKIESIPAPLRVSYTYICTYVRMAPAHASEHFLAYALK